MAIDKLSPNCKKTYYMEFSGRAKKHVNQPILFQGQRIEKAHKYEPGPWISRSLW